MIHITVRYKPATGIPTEVISGESYDIDFMAVLSINKGSGRTILIPLDNILKVDIEVKS